MAENCHLLGEMARPEGMPFACQINALDNSGVPSRGVESIGVLRHLASRNPTSQTLGGEKNSMKEDWQPIETAPRDGQRVLLWSSQWTAPACGIWGNAWTVGYDLPPYLYEPTHWMPLPPPPLNGS